MITRIEAENFRCLRYANQPLGRFHVLIGPNASGKTTFLDVIGFLGRMVASGPEAAAMERASNFMDLLWNRQGEWFELAVEAAIPEHIQNKLNNAFGVFRYEVRVGLDPATHELGILDEKAWLRPVKDSKAEADARQLDLFPAEPAVPDSVITGKAKPKWQRVLSKAYGGNDNFYVEARDPGSGKGWFPSIRLGPRKSALANIPEDEIKFPASTWFKRMLMDGVQHFSLNSRLIRQASPPNQGRGMKPDGSNLPWVIRDLSEAKNRQRFEWWIEHLRTALPDIESIRAREMEDTRHCYLIIRYKGGLEVPSWMASDGTLRLLALTILAYVPDSDGILLVEEPENGIHPRAIETMFQSLSSVYGAQVLLATHSPVILSVAQPESVLCFNKAPSGASDIVVGSRHPALRAWKGEVDLGTLYAGGVLG